MALKEAEYVVQQYYTVKIDKKAIDKHIDAIRYVNESDEDIDDDGDREKEKHFFHRLFSAIMADRKALNIILEWMVLLEHDPDCISGQYGKEVGFADVLFSMKSCFSREDQAMLEKMSRDAEDDHEYDLHLQFEALLDAFQWEPSGFHVAEHTCARKEGA